MPLLKISWPDVLGFISWLSLPFHWSVQLFSYQYHTVSITIALNYSLKSKCDNVSALFFGYLGLLWFHVNFRTVFIFLWMPNFWTVQAVWSGSTEDSVGKLSCVWQCRLLDGLGDCPWKVYLKATLNSSHKLLILAQHDRFWLSGITWVEWGVVCRQSRYTGYRWEIGAVLSAYLPNLEESGYS